MNIQQNQFNLEQNDHKIISSIASSIDGLLLASGSEDAQIILQDLYERKYLQQFQDYKEKVNCLKFQSNKKVLISTRVDEINEFEDSVIKNWNVEYPYDDLVPKYIIKFFHEQQKICFNELDTKMLTKNSENLIQECNYEYQNQQETFYCSNQIIDQIQINYNKYFMSFNYLIFKNAQIDYWNKMDLKTLKKNQIKLNQIEIVSFFSGKEQEIFILMLKNQQVQLVKLIESG